MIQLAKQCQAEAKAKISLTEAELKVARERLATERGRIALENASSLYVSDRVND
jgi:hypothetical protein